MSRTKTNIKIKLEKDYDDFKSFYDENIVLIYKSTVELFSLFKNNRVKKLRLSVDAKIDGLKWGTDFEYSRTDSIILVRDLLPYFENIEDFETCIEIRDIYNDLNKIN